MRAAKFDARPALLRAARFNARSQKLMRDVKIDSQCRNSYGNHMEADAMDTCDRDSFSDEMRIPQ